MPVLIRSMKILIIYVQYSTGVQNLSPAVDVGDAVEVGGQLIRAVRVVPDHLAELHVRGLKVKLPPGTQAQYLAAEANIYESNFGF